jgi:hypothetical protein
MEISLLKRSRAARLPCVVALAMILGAASVGGQPAEKPVRNEGIAVCAHFAQWWNVDEIMPTLSKLGAGWIRDAVYWDEVEPKKGEYQVPAKSLKWIDAAHRNGFKVIVTFAHANPCYTDPFDADAYAKAAAFVAKELKGKIHAIEVLNEPNNMAAGLRKAYGGTWAGVEADGKISPWVLKYLEILNKTGDAVQAANREVKVVGMGANTNTNFDLYALGVSKNVAGVTFHPYSSRGIPEVMGAGKKLETASFAEGDTKFAEVLNNYRQGSFAGLIRAYQSLAKTTGGPAEIWLTEWGYSTWVEGRGSNPGNFAGFTPEAQAKYLQRRTLECLGLGVQVSAVYAFMDDGKNRYEVEHNFGLVTRDLQEKPAYGAMQRLAKETLGFKAKADAAKVSVFQKSDRSLPPDARIKSPGSITSYVFNDADGKLAVAIWSVEPVGDSTPRLADVEVTANFTDTPTVEATDLWTGEKNKLKPGGNTKRVMLEQMEIPDSPVLLRFN